MDALIYPRAEGVAWPYPLFDALREKRVYHVPGTNRFLVTRYEDAVWVARRPNIFSSRKGFLKDEDPDVGLIAAGGYPPVPTVVDNDDPGHAVYRELILRALAPALLPAAIEESLRFYSPTQWSQRVCLEDTEIGGAPIPKGAQVFFVLAAANRDPDMFENPAEFNVKRPNNRRHIAFGTGIHACVGAPLARLEGRIAFERLLTRIRGWRLASDAPFEYGSNPMVRGLVRLDLAFEAAALGAGSRP